MISSREQIIEKLKKSTSEESYITLIKQLIEWVEVNEKEKLVHMNKPKTILPISLKNSNIFINESLYNSLPKAIYNINLSKLPRESDDKDSYIKDIKKELHSFLKEEKIQLFGVYNIISISEDVESTTYGFLENNIDYNKMMMGFEDTLAFIELMREKYRDFFNNDFEYEEEDNENEQEQEQENSVFNKKGRKRLI